MTERAKHIGPLHTPERYDEIASLRAEVERLTNVEIAHGFALEKLGELRAEVERLTGEIAASRTKKDRYYLRKSHRDQHEGIEALRAEVERLTGQLADCEEANCERKARVAELEGENECLKELMRLRDRAALKEEEEQKS